ncbi:MAG: SDR family NAD(P)-dependent oxidoreductase [bacterium]|nr:SDR family NAD(P)-dependent oxidoreductase [bacterium]MCY3889327.1 SDR family NAD(P)-dependent oxidoreductase [bacterium]MCY3960093.1 SDR family NAD(P)-dependent oxidoreductase [bacterium]
MKRFEGKNAIVTGASRGIGRGIAQRLAAEGANVAITARTLDAHPTLPGSLNETLAELNAFPGTHIAIQADLGDADSRTAIVPQAREALGPIDILVNNAAAAIYQSMNGYPLKRRRLMLEINLLAPHDLTEAVLPDMESAGEGWIVNLSSATANLAVGPPFPADGVKGIFGFYGTTKAALNRMTSAWAVELHPRNIRINTIEPLAAVLSEGADELVGGILRPDQIESMEAMVEAAVALCDCPIERCGQILSSLPLLDELGLTVMTLDATAPYPGGHRPA